MRESIPCRSRCQELVEHSLQSQTIACAHRATLSLQVQVQVPRLAHSSKGRKVAGGQDLSPVFQLPMKSEPDSTGKPQLERGAHCFLPLMALAENAQSIRIFVGAGDQLGDGHRFIADCIELQCNSIRSQQGIYKCSGAADCHYVCVKAASEAVQVCGGVQLIFQI